MTVIPGCSICRDGRFFCLMSIIVYSRKEALFFFELWHYGYGLGNCDTGNAKNAALQVLYRQQRHQHRARQRHGTMDERISYGSGRSTSTATSATTPTTSAAAQISHQSSQPSAPQRKEQPPGTHELARQPFVRQASQYAKKTSPVRVAIPSCPVAERCITVPFRREEQYFYNPVLS